MIQLLAALPATPSPTPQVIQQVVEKTIKYTQEIPVTPNDIKTLLMVAALFLVGWALSWLQAFVNTHKEVGEKINVVVTALYAIVLPTGYIMWQDGQLDFTSFTHGLSSAAIVLLAAWVRHNGGKLTRRSGAPVDAPQLNAPATEQVVPQKANA